MNLRQLTAKLVIEQGTDFVNTVSMYPEAYKPEIVESLRQMVSAVEVPRDDASFIEELKKVANEMFLIASVSLN